MSDSRNYVEALLFSSGRAMSVDEMVAVTGLEKKNIKKALKDLKDFYDSLDSSLMVTQEGNLWKLNVREKYVSLVTKIVVDTELARAVLQTLSVIAWKSPVLQSEVVKIRGANAYDHIKELVDGGFVTKEKEGRSYKLKISEKFYEYFDVPGDKGIKEAFKVAKMPEKKEPAKLGDLDIVPVQNNSHEHGKTAEIFGTGKQEFENSEEAEQEKDEKNTIPPIDHDFLDKVGTHIENISKKNDELDGDELFKRRQPSEEETENSGEEDGSRPESEADTERLGDDEEQDTSYESKEENPDQTEELEESSEETEKEKENASG